MTQTIVILQPMYFPWPGYFELVRLADVFVLYDDVQLPQGRSLIKRVQMKTAQGMRWLTAPTVKGALQTIGATRLDPEQAWQTDHLNLLRAHYRKAPFFGQMMALVEAVFDQNHRELGALNEACIRAIAACLNLETTFLRSSTLNLPGRGSDRIFDLVTHLGGARYLTGHGSRHYLDHERFEAAGIQVDYMNYHIKPYPQRHGPFTPYVTSLDLIAALGPDSRSVLHSGTVPWRTFLG